MESLCVRHTLIPATSRLFSDFLYHFERVEGFFSHWFGDRNSYKSAASAIDYPDDRRAALVAALGPSNPDEAALSRLARPGTVAVVTGQQVGLLSGPAYTIFKALTAVRLAEQLTASGTPAVPIFWLATEDHDLAEVDHAWVFDQDATPSKVEFSSVSNGQPVGRYTPEQCPMDDLRSKLGDLPYADEVVARLQVAYQPGATLGTGFLAFLQDLLKGFGLIFIDPLLPAVREIAAPLLTSAVERLPELLPLLRERNKDLERAGYHAQVNVDEDSSLLFVVNGKRAPVRWKDGQFQTKERSYEVTELAGLGAAISPNALLRPVMQDYLLPTVAYVGGPAEIAYMAQSAVLYDRLLGRMPVIVPRNSFTLLDARAEKVLRRYGMSVPDLLHPHETVRARMAHRLIPEDLASKLADARAAVGSSLESVQTALSAFDTTLGTATQKSAAKIAYQLAKIEAKAARESLRRSEAAARDANYVLNYIYPHRHLQERFYSIVPFLAAAGLDLPQRLYEQVQLTCPDHMVRTV